MNNIMTKKAVAILLALILIVFVASQMTKRNNSDGNPGAETSTQAGDSVETQNSGTESKTGNEATDAAKQEAEGESSDASKKEAEGKTADASDSESEDKSDNTKETDTEKEDDNEPEEEDGEMPINELDTVEADSDTSDASSGNIGSQSTEGGENETSMMTDF